MMIYELKNKFESIEEEKAFAFEHSILDTVPKDLLYFYYGFLQAAAKDYKSFSLSNCYCFEVNGENKDVEQAHNILKRIYREVILTEIRDTDTRRVLLSWKYLNCYEDFSSLSSAFYFPSHYRIMFGSGLSDDEFYKKCSVYFLAQKTLILKCEEKDGEES